MKKFLMLVFFVVAVLRSFSCLAADTRQPQTNLAKDADYELTLPDVVKNLIAVGSYFDEKYAGAAIDEDFAEDVAEKFPELSVQQVFNREETIRFWIKIYRLGKSMYEMVKAKMLIPEEPPLIVSETQYDLPKERAYIESEDMVVVEDFKKVLSYGANLRDFKAYVAKHKKDREKDRPQNDFDKLNGLLKKIEWKKMPYYGIIYDNPFTGKQGSGEWVKTDGAEIRLISEYSTVNNRQEIRAGIHFNLKKNWFVLAQNYKEFAKPVFSFDDSENLESAAYFYPVPLRLSADSGESVAVWQRNFMLPLQIRLKNASQPLKLKTKADFTLCNLQLECHLAHIDAELDLQAGEGFYSSVNNFIIQSFNFLPKDKTPEFRLAKAVIDEADAEGHQVLRLEFDARAKLDNFDVYVESADNIAFRRPRLAVGDFGLTARLEPKNPEQKLIGKTFEITARLNNMSFLRKTITVEKASVFDHRSGSLSVTLLLMAVLGGFILNFMPCVFPVLSLKLLSLTRFGAGNQENMRRNFTYTVLGIFAAFEIVALLLSLLKLAGRSIGWGMQFQSPVFLVIMIFSIAIFLAVVCGLFNIRVPQWFERRLFPTQTHEKFPHLLTGMLAVFMATPCTAPYLGTAVGFALAGTVSDIWLILNAVALGLSLPYLLVLLSPSLTAFFPKPGAWMDKLNYLMGLMLFLTLLWLLSILFAQTGFWPAFRLGLYAVFFFFVLYYRKEALDAVECSEFESEIKMRVRQFYNRAILLLSLVVFAIASVDVVTNFNKMQNKRISERASYIDYEAISNKIREGKMVIVAVGADWCLTCKYNEALVFNNAIVENLLKNSNTELISVDWTSYNPEILKFMKKFGRQGLPFYVVFSPMVPDGMVMPEILSERTLSKILRSISD